jgi:hypothetical protein
MTSLSSRARDAELTAIYEEYRAVYDLALFRLNALDKRAPLTVAAFAAVLVSVQSLPISAQLLVLLFLPPSLIWLMRTTVNHARSFEDALRRIEWLEVSANQRLGTEVLGFQSHHPSRGREVGGRTGKETVLAVLGSILLLLAVTGYQMQVTGLLPSPVRWAYHAGLIVIAALCAWQRVSLRQYRYHPAGDR